MLTVEYLHFILRIELVENGRVRQMPIIYNRLWKLLIDKEMTKTQLRKEIGIGTATLAKLSANEKVSMDVIERICVALDCQPGDIMEFVSEK